MADVGKTRMWVVEASRGVCKGQLLLIFSSILTASAMILNEVRDSRDTRQALRMPGVSQLPIVREHCPHICFIFLPANSKFFLLNKPDQPAKRYTYFKQNSIIKKKYWLRTECPNKCQYNASIYY